MRCAVLVALTTLAFPLLASAGSDKAHDAVRGAPVTHADETGKAWHLWGTREIRSTRMTAFAKWNGMYERYHREQLRRAARFASDCQGADPASSTASEASGPNRRSFAALVALARARRAQAGSMKQADRRRVGPATTSCSQASWQRFLDSIQGLQPRDQLARVNTYLNRAPYIIDPVNWGVADYWATPTEFLRKDGDCEDYAIAKYLALKSLGFDPAVMRIVVLEDRNLKVDHAVLAVRLDGEIYILDNQTPRIVEASRIHHYRPVYSINEQAWWLHSGWRPTDPRAGTPSGKVWTAMR